MDPKEFDWDESQQVTVVNPTDKDYPFKVHGKEYVIHAGEAAKMPGYIAWLYVYGLASQLAQADGKFERWNEEGFRPTYYSKLVKAIDNVVQQVAPEPEPEVVPESPKTQPAKAKA